jgi:hypothetical protein
MDMQTRAIDSNLLTSSKFYKPSIKAFKAWCEQEGYTVPTDMKPSWKHETIEGLVELYTPSFGESRAFVIAVSMLSVEHHAFIDEIGTPDVNSYHRLPIRMHTLQVHDPTHPIDSLYRLKQVLSKGSPVVISITTFAKYIVNRKGEKILEKQWLTEAPKASNGYIIGLPPIPEYEVDGGHAICVCAYDDDRKAIRFKNSWGIGYADHGYAWLSYEYLQKYTFEAFVLMKEGR